MTEQQQNQMPVSEHEVEVIKRAFKGDEQMLKSMRALMLGLEVSDAEKQAIKKLFADEELYKIVCRRFAPQLDRNAPIGQVQDMWLGAEQMVFGQMESTIEQAIQYKDLSIKMTKEALGLLRNPDGQRMNIVYDPTTLVGDTLGVQLLGRNQFLRHVEQQLLFLHLIAERKDETKEEQDKRNKQNSSQ